MRVILGKWFSLLFIGGGLRPMTRLLLERLTAFLTMSVCSLFFTVLKLPLLMFPSFSR